MAQGLRQFDLDRYKVYSPAELAILAAATIGMLAILDPEAYGHGPFHIRRDFARAASNMSAGLREQFHRNPRRPYSRAWGKRHRK